MPISTANEQQWIKDLLDWDSDDAVRNAMGINGQPFSWSGNSNTAVTIKYSLDYTKATATIPSGLAPDITNIDNIGATQQQVESILESISNVANITFVLDNTDPDLVFARAEE